MFSEQELLAYLISRFAPRAVILYGSAATGELTASSDIDVVCFVDGDARYPELGRWQGLLLDVWVHPLKDAELVDDFLKLHDGHVLLDQDDKAKILIQRVSERLSQRPTPLDAHEMRHRKAWVWKMFDRACRGGIEGDHRRHWLLHDLPQTWCEIMRHHYLGPGDAFRRMKSDAEVTFLAVQRALKPEASLRHIEQAVIAVVGERELSNA